MFAVKYLKALEKEIAIQDIETLKTIYVGGGTPTALEDDLFLELLEIIKPYTEAVEEYTFEANPESLSESKIKLLKKYGVNRISLGVQSTDSKVLKAINRQHDYQDVIKAIKTLKENDINNINVDLILGLPHSSEALLKRDLENLTSLGIKHISCYALTIHPHTVLFTQGYKEMDDDLMRKNYDIVDAFLKEKDFIHYEVSNWCLPSYQSKHNLTYWRNEQYYGCGLGAAAYIGNYRYKNTINLDKYLKGEYIAEKEEVTLKDALTYQVMLSLRTNEGLSLKLLKDRYNLDLLKTKSEEINSLVKQGYLFIKDDKLCPTYAGMMILDTIILKLI